MILDGLRVEKDEFERRTGWAIKPQGACKGEMCVPLPPGDGAGFDVAMLAERLGMPLIRDETSGVWCLGPESGGKVLAGAEAPDFTLPDWHGEDFTLSSLRGRKVLLLAWASW